MKNYKGIWNNLSTNFADAGHFVSCITDEDDMRHNGQLTAGFLGDLLQIGPADKVPGLRHNLGASSPRRRAL